MTFEPPIERRPLSDIIALQEQKLRDLIKWLSSNSTFYRNHFKKNGIAPEKIRSIDDLLNIPVTTKDDLQLHNFDFLCVERAQVAEYTSTSGTLGRPVSIALSKADLDRLAYNEAISFATADSTSKDVFQLMLTLDRQFMAGIAYYQGVRALGGTVVRVGPGVPAMQWDAIQRIQPTCLVAVPSFILKLIEYADQHSIDLSATSVKKAICIGESLRKENFANSVIAERILSRWDLKLYGTYASTEMQTAFTECMHGRGGHLHPELIIAEILDDSDRPVASGGAGEVVVTTLGVEAMPLLRYKTGDIARAYYEPCACGRTTMRIGPVLGRKQQLIKLKGTTIYPAGIFEILHSVGNVSDYVVEVMTGTLGTDELRIYLDLDNSQDVSVIQRELTSKFQSVLRVVPEVVFCKPGQLEQLQAGRGERKLRRFIDSRK